jgi:hypothetical protein
MEDLSSLTDVELLNLWDSTLDFGERDTIVEELKRRDLFPKAAMTKWEAETGAYPLFDDPEFLQKLLAKREFAESLQTSWKPSSDPCGPQEFFEVTPVQRFVANLMSPKSPYMSALLYHGVGVGKTCAAIQITESWLEAYPRDKVIVVTPQTIKQGFYNTIFDTEKVEISKEEGVPNRAIGCLGDKYMKITGTLLERDRARIQRRVTQAINRRYDFYGYISFANKIIDLTSGISADKTPEEREKIQAKLIQKEFNGRLLIIDEAHNLRDLPQDKADEDSDSPGGEAEIADAKAGKLLTPELSKVLRAAEGLKLVLMTATPMYNSYREIIFILNLLLQNDKKALLVESDIFTKTGDFRNEAAKEKLGNIARHYVSFMRGENPVSFPIRLFPRGVEGLTRENYPKLNPRNAPVNKAENIFIDYLPIVPITLTGDNLKASLAFMNDLPPVTTKIDGAGGLSSIVLEKLVHAGNFILPATDDTAGDTLADYRARTEADGFRRLFTRETIGGEVRYRAINPGGARWLGVDQLTPYSDKFIFLLNKLKNGEGVSFVYTRFINAGALPLALVLEANGYTPAGRRSGILADGIQTSGRRQCALCPLREDEHKKMEGSDHTFTPAYYGLLTGDISLSPKNADIIKLEQNVANVNGGKLKVIIGSQVASEGVDLKYIREIHVLDSWFHLNKTEQILGRGIRYRSHCLLPFEKRNTTIYLYAATLPTEMSRETADLYSYRVAFRKAVQVGRVSRVLKESAIDCNLNHDAIIISGQPPVRQVDSQRVERPDVNINDMPFTAVCDWTECAYDCKPKIAVVPGGTDDSTYSDFAARWRENSLKRRIRLLFEEQTSYRDEDLIEMLDIPQANIVDLLLQIVDNRYFQVKHKGVNGYIRYCNKYFIFQPNAYGDLKVPMALRAARVPVKRDEYNPTIRELVEEADEDVTGEEAKGENEEEGAVESTEGIEETWDAFVNWTTAMAGAAEPVKVHDKIFSKIRSLSKGDKEIEKKLKMVLEMANWFQRAYISSDRKNPEKMRDALLEYFWDNWFSIEEQRYLITRRTPGANTMVSYTRYTIGKINVLRLFKSSDASIEYLCEGGEPCRAAVVEEIEKDKADPLRRIDLTARGTGALYGFLVSKNGHLVFKTNTPIKNVGDKPGKGSECANVSTIRIHLDKLRKIAPVLSANGFTDFQLNDVMMTSRYKIEHATRACTLLEMVLRYMDGVGVERKRWFLRPVGAFYADLKSEFKVGKKAKESKK